MTRLDIVYTGTIDEELDAAIIKFAAANKYSFRANGYSVIEDERDLSFERKDENGQAKKG